MNKQMKVSISNGNSKMGAIPSVSLPPVITCPKNAPCGKKCYAAKLCRIYPSVKKAYDNNYNIWKNNPGEYWEQVNKAVSMTKYFRFHVSGDIPNIEYFIELISLAERNPSTQILIFTKQYATVNIYLDIIEKLPENLRLILSAWGNAPISNRHNLPVAQVIFKGVEPNENWKICGGNCADCACRGVGCWELKKGETIAFYEH